MHRCFPDDDNDSVREVEVEGSAWERTMSRRVDGDGFDADAVDVEIDRGRQVWDGEGISDAHRKVRTFILVVPFSL